MAPWLVAITHAGQLRQRLAATAHWCLVEPSRFATRLRLVLALLWRTHPLLTLLTGILRLVQSLMLLGLFYGGRRALDELSAGGGTVHRFGLSGPTTALLLTLAVGSIVFAQAAQAAQTILGELLIQRIHTRVFQKASTLPYAHFESSRFFDALSRAQREASFRPVTILFALLDSGTALLTVLGLLLLVARSSPWLGVALLAASLPYLIGQTRHAYLAWRLAQWATPETREMGYIGFILTDRQTAKEVRLFGFGPYLLTRRATIFADHHARTRQLTLARAGWGIVTGAIAATAFVGGVIYLGRAVADGALSAGSATVVVGALLVGQRQVQAFIEAVSTLYENSRFIDDLFGFLDLPEPEPPATITATPTVAERGLRFEHVSFRYPDAADATVHDVSLDLRPGEIVALVGANGAGKTTLVKLLCGLYEPGAGRLLLDGVDLAAVSRDVLWQRVAVNFQDYARYALSARENVGLGAIEALADDARLSAALASAGANVIVAGLPHGLDTRLGRMFEEGVDLSDGQWQRVALARALFKDAPLLVLDEPTASADPQAEYQFFQGVLRRVRQQPDHSVLLISHRFANVRLADRIYVIDGGRVVASGTHDALMSEGGLYAQMFAVQAAGYQ